MTTNTTVLITGNTFPVKDQIRALGGRWDAGAKGWRVPAEKADAARALVSGPQAQLQRSASNGATPRLGGRCRGCKGAIRHAAHHRAMGGLCGNCAFDEYDC